MRYTSSPIQCGRCSNQSPMEILHEEKRYAGDEPDTPLVYYNVYATLRCNGCDEINIVLFHDDNHETPYDDPYHNYQMLWPPPPKTFGGLPELILRAYNVSLQVKHINAGHYAVALGNILQAICRDKGIDTRNLSMALAELAKQEKLPSWLQDIATQVRLMRNAGAHFDIHEINEEDIPRLEVLCHGVIEYIYALELLEHKIQQQRDALSNQ